MYIFLLEYIDFLGQKDKIIVLSRSTATMLFDVSGLRRTTFSPKYRPEAVRFDHLVDQKSHEAYDRHNLKDIIPAFL